MHKNVTYVAQIAYFCIRPNKRRETKNFWLFLATFEQLSLQKATFDFFGATLEQLLEKFRTTCGKP